MHCQDLVIDRFLSLQSQIVRELLPSYARIERNGSKIVIIFKAERWKYFFQKYHFPLEPGEDLKLSFEFRVESVRPVHLAQKIPT